VTEATAANVEQGGATTVPAHLLYDIVRKLPDGAEVMLKMEKLDLPTLEAAYEGAG
jgi:DNA polymerase-3 subunit beta